MLAEGVSQSCVAGVMVVAVNGESVVSAACTRDGSVRIGGRLVVGGTDDGVVRVLCGLFPGENLDL